MGGRGASGGSGFAAKGFSPENLDNHYADHGWQFTDKDGKVISKIEYNDKAKKLFLYPVNKNILEFERSDGRIMRYKKDSNELSIAESDER